MDKNWTTIETLRQTRHDWLNRIQIIKGNLELNKIDRVKGIIDEIIIETQNEARLTNLNLPKFSEMLLTSNWNNGSFYCEYEIIDVFEGSTELDELMYRWTNDYFKVLEKNLDPFFENILAVSMCKKEISDMRCSFHMQGRFIDQAAVMEFLEKSLTAEQSIDILECNEDELFFKMDIKF
ncbi:Spo0B domain-containing protein [Peribacillus sp. TH16]|uniref:Spo0B domain-containing protein n=1 Tax=unclassified Peribacillus TaxID=2675266 RepID=UPI00191209BC|nr:MULTISPECIES: Spo0B domain-containing protein [unclassified Peribacillus]MBK5462486.1 Spo0B domain-containing protein [Peribacillus sp. TH27]MBK5484176.1 Spo0B domain-containing protein [Peribacillus sp. TH16]